MSQGTEHHLEEAQHTPHLAADPFDKRVAMTMAIVAACLACIAMLSHREHNETLANLSRASDQWGYYQAKKNRGYMYDALADLLAEQTDEAHNAKAKERVDKWKKKAKDYEDDAKGIQDEARNLAANAHHAHTKSTRFDLGELGVELALVLCSLAVLTKRKPFWLSGIAVGVVGIVVAASAFTISKEHSEQPHGGEQQRTTQPSGESSH